MPPRTTKIALLRRPELLLAEEFSSSLDPVTPAIWLAPFCPAVSWFFGFCWPTQSSQEGIPTRAGHAVANFVGTAFFNSDLSPYTFSVFWDKLILIDTKFQPHKREPMIKI